MARRPSWRAASNVEPDPANGSNTVSPGQDDSRIARRATSTGNGAG